MTPDENEDDEEKKGPYGDLGAQGLRTRSPLRNLASASALEGHVFSG